MSSDPVNPEQSFDEVDAKRIMERAAALDAQRGSRLDAAALRAIASEAGISPAAVDQAIRERLQPSAPSVRSWPARHAGLLILLGLAGAVVISRLFPM
jgi:hypothetical protein